jgi:quinoprotein glucose dehydrogenase
VLESDIIDFTPEVHKRAMEIISKYKLGPVFTPPVVSNLNGPLATLTLGTASGGTNWPGASFDPETHTVYAYACNACLTPIMLVESPKEISDMRYIMGIAGYAPSIARGPGENAGADSPMPKPEPRSNAPAPPNPYQALNVDGMPLIKPPYSTISAINVDRGEIMWQIAHGETPDNIRAWAKDHHVDIPRTGQAGYNIGTLVTKTLVIAGDGQVTTTSDHPRGAMLRAYDKANGKQVGAVFIPAPQSGSPMTYALNGKQYIIVAVSGGNYSGEYLAFALPEEESRSTSGGGSRQ